MSLYMVDTGHTVRAASELEMPDETILIVESARGGDDGLHIPLYGDSVERAKQFVTGRQQIREVVYEASNKVPYVRIVGEEGMLVLPVPAAEIDHARNFFTAGESRQIA